jgi:hypothetical protein
MTSQRTMAQIVRHLTRPGHVLSVAGTSIVVRRHRRGYRAHIEYADGDVQEVTRPTIRGMYRWLSGLYRAEGWAA